jgi:uncharacterized protein YbjT (DUF2867 family)
MARILVIGASRGIGREAVRLALEKGHDVRAMARDPAPLGAGDAGLELFAGDATDPDRIRQALAGADAVIQALGIRVSHRIYTEPVTLFSRATEVLVSAMEARGPRRLVAVTGIGCGDSVSALSRLEIIARDLALGPVYRDKNVQESLIRGSALDWTLVRPTFLTRGRRTGRYRVMAEPGAWRNGMIARADVADFLVARLFDGSYLRKAPVLAY